MTNTRNSFEEKTADCIRLQEEVGLDVLVHGEFERNDMVEYFGEQLDGFAFTENGWVQSYGSRCVKPPIIYGDVRRPHRDDRGMVSLCAIANIQTDEGYAYWPDHYSPVELCARRSAAERNSATNRFGNPR